MNNLQLTLLLCVFAGLFLQVLNRIDSWIGTIITMIAFLSVGLIIGFFASNKKIVRGEKE